MPPRTAYLTRAADATAAASWTADLALVQRVRDMLVASVPMAVIASETGLTEADIAIGTSVTRELAAAHAHGVNRQRFALRSTAVDLAENALNTLMDIAGNEDAPANARVAAAKEVLAVAGMFGKEAADAERKYAGEKVEATDAERLAEIGRLVTEAIVSGRGGAGGAGGVGGASVPAGAAGQDYGIIDVSAD